MMILGRGDAQTDAAIVAEYHTFLDTYGSEFAPVTLRRYKQAPVLMQHRLGKGVRQWIEDDIMRLYAEPQNMRVRFLRLPGISVFPGILSRKF
jgi:hypothetical protein